ncbi:MAG TPA: hypothetical protein VJ960_08405 [Oceanipulchritudo sp.]|nr:hypothetical protein [Oceanipulchritudo sp.]
MQYNNRRKVFSLDTDRGKMEFPYACADPQPVRGNYVREAFADPELGNEAFTYRLESGEEGAIHGDSVLEQNQDPDHLSELMLYHMNLALRKTVAESSLSKREIIRKSKISAPQLYHLLNPANSQKSASQIFRVFYVLDRDLEFNIRERRPRHASVGTRRRYAVSAATTKVF